MDCPNENTICVPGTDMACTPCRQEAKKDKPPKAPYHR